MSALVWDYAMGTMTTMATQGQIDGAVLVTVRADPDEDDCLTAAAEAYIAAEHPELRGWDLDPRWGDDERETVTLAVPAWAVHP